MNSSATPFLITIDTEGDNVWSRPRVPTTRNAAWLPAFQDLARKFGFRPTWLVNWEMARDAACVEFLREMLAQNGGEVGMHLHAWDTPPLEPLTANDQKHHPFQGEYPEAVLYAKLERLKGLLEDTFQKPIRSHRAGRWALDGHTVKWLRQNGFTADCSVCPGIDWRATPGSPSGLGGPDYRKAPQEPYYLDDQDVNLPTKNTSVIPLLEVPMTIWSSPWPWARTIMETFSKRHFWLRPNGRNGAAMRAYLSHSLAAGCSYLMFMLHSSELMPGGSPTFKTETSIARLHDDIQGLFSLAHARGCTGLTLSEFAEKWQQKLTRVA